MNIRGCLVLLHTHYFVSVLDKYPRMFGIPNKIMVHDEQVINYDAQARLRGYTYFTIIDTDEFIVPINRSIKTFTDLMVIIYEPRL